MRVTICPVKLRTPPFRSNL